MLNDEAPRARRGPRPLALHLAAAQSTWLGSLTALPLLKAKFDKWPSKRLGKEMNALAARVADLQNDSRPNDSWPNDRWPNDCWTAAVEREVRRRSDLFLTGLERYRHHAYRRELADPPTIWQEGTTRILDYGAPGDRPLFVVPSLINRGYVLDLSNRRSFLRWLAGQGVRPLLVDWGAPGEVERRFSLTDYIAGRLERGLDAVSGREAIPVLGYCMGGLLATALAARRPERVAGLVLMATPWDFHADGANKAQRLATLYGLWQGWADRLGVLPLDAIQALFMTLDPLLAVKKFSRFATMDQTGPGAEAFVALEDWLNDGVPLAASVARICLIDWYGQNTPAMGNWRIAGQPIDPSALDLPSLHLIPARDRIVPPASARALAEAMRDAHILEPPLGHIGMVVSGAAKPQVWAVVADWLNELSDPSVSRAL